MTALPFLTAYDPPATSEGTLDPLGMYQIADQLAVRLVPGVRERMQRVRFLTVISVGAVVTEGLEANPRHLETPPFLVWEWLVVEAIVRAGLADGTTKGVPGTLVTRRAIHNHGYLDQRSYLKVPRIFGFHGVYKRLADHLRLIDMDIEPRHPRCDELIQAWARGHSAGRFCLDHDLATKWRKAVERCLRESPVRTRCSWSSADWEELAKLTGPDAIGGWEKRYLRDLLQGDETTDTGALPDIWRLQEGFGEDKFTEEQLHEQLLSTSPAYAGLLHAIVAYERFCRSLQDCFSVLRARASVSDTRGFVVTSVASDGEFQSSAEPVYKQFQRAAELLAETQPHEYAAFQAKFSQFGVAMTPAELALALCEHHESVQRGKSADGKRPWFDRLGTDRIYMRQNYRSPQAELAPQRYVHDYRGRPIRQFWLDLR